MGGESWLHLNKYIGNSEEKDEDDDADTWNFRLDHTFFSLRVTSVMEFDRTLSFLN